MPAGVPGLPPPPPPLLPQPTKATASAAEASKPNASFSLRPLASSMNRKSSPARIAVPPGMVQFGPRAGGVAEGAVVLNVMTEVVVDDPGFIEQVGGACVTTGVMAQANETVPVNPLMGLTVMVEVADWGGVIELGLAAVEDRVKLAAPVTVTDVAGEVEVR